jgi:peptidoglycan/LPS O-acetylase OafA/YrhL
MARVSIIDRRKRTTPIALLATVLSVAALSLGPILLMAQSREDGIIMFLTCLPLSGLSFAWLWRERRRIILRWAAICFAAAVFCWLVFLIYFIFESHDERRGLILVAADLLTNCILFVVLNRTWSRRRVSEKVEQEMLVI